MSERTELLPICLINSRGRVLSGYCWHDSIELALSNIGDTFRAVERMEFQQLREINRATPINKGV